MNRNPLKSPILSILQQHPEGLSEYELIKALEALNLIEQSSEQSTELALFQTHFVVMNALYHIEQELNGDQLLAVSALNIQLHTPSKTSSDCTDLDDQLAPQEVKDYYLNWDNFNDADEASVNQLLNQFWERYLASDQRMWAFDIFEIQPESQWKDVQKRYRQLSQQHHPDKGGKHERFVEVCQAYEVLTKTYGKA